MARYIDLDKVEFLKADGNKEFNHGVDCCINKLLKIEPADVIERSKIDKAMKQITDSMNEHLASDGTPIDEYAYCYLNALEILEENIGE